MTDRSRDYLASQDGSQDLFDGGAPELEESIDQPNRVLLEEILKEQRKLTCKVHELEGQVGRLNRALEDRNLKFSVQGSSIEGDFINKLKKHFSCCPWIDPQEKNVQDEVKRLLKKEGRKGECGAVQMFSYATTKFTYYRNQIRSKLTSNKETDVEGMSFKEVHNMLWKHFLPVGEEVMTDGRQQLTLMLRIFCAKTNSYKKSHCPKFWEDFKTFYTEVQNDNRPDKWERMAAKEDRRLSRYCVDA